MSAIELEDTPMAYLGPNAPAITAAEMTSFYEPRSIDPIEAALLLLADGPGIAKDVALAKFETAAKSLDVGLIQYWANVYTEIGRMTPTGPVQTE